MNQVITMLKMIFRRIKSMDLWEYWHKTAIFDFLRAIIYWCQTQRK